MSRLDRQSFLGPDSNERLHAATVGFVGVGGGGSHVAQQAAHLGIGGYVIVDPDEIDFTNTNRLIGGTLADLEGAEGPKAKVALAERQIRGLEPQARITPIKDTWHNAISYLRTCDAIIGGVDSFIEREQLERFCRRNLIPYIDIGMDVHELGKKEFLIGGQVILSMPGNPCMRCCGYITDDRLKLEAGKYGAAGIRFFRAMARTVLDEVLVFHADFIEHQPAHTVRDPNGCAYNRTTHLHNAEGVNRADSGNTSGSRSRTRLVADNLLYA